MTPIIGFAGNGHLMIESAAAAYTKGFKVVKYVPAKTGDWLGDLTACDIVYICPDRPSNISPRQMVNLVIPYLKPDAILVILCQVHPGFTSKIDWPDSQLFYQVETLITTDTTMDRSLNPERIIIGCKSTIPAPMQLFLDSFSCPIILMSYEEAELAKIAINIYLAAQVCVTSTLAAVAKDIGADWGCIIPALKTDKRIGEYAYLKTGKGCGPHLERDLKAINEYDCIDTVVTEALLKYSDSLSNNIG